MGEADLKFARWATRLGVDMAIEATDGDFIPIALLQPHDDQQIAIQRFELGSSARAYEWVHIPTLREALCATMRRHKRAPTPSWPRWEMDCLVMMIALTGTDYSRGMPWIGPKKVWKLLPTVLPRVLTCFDGPEPSINPELSIDWCVADVYAQVALLRCSSMCLGPLVSRARTRRRSRSISFCWPWVRLSISLYTACAASPISTPITSGHMVPGARVPAYSARSRCSARCSNAPHASVDWDSVSIGGNFSSK